MKPLFKKHRFWIIPSLCLIVLAAVFFMTSPGQSVLASAVKRQLPIYCVQKDSPVISLSFDAAWGNARLRTF